MTRRTKLFAPYKHPSTYADIVKAANEKHARRLAELKAAAKVIIALEPDLAALAEQGIYYSIDNYSMRIVAWPWPFGEPARKALRINGFMVGESDDRMASAFIARSWIAEDVKVDGRFSKILLRRPKTRIRLELDCSEAFAKQLCPEPATEVA